MDDNFSSRVKDVIAYSKEEALRLGHNFIGTEHLMLGMLRDGNGKAISILKSIEIDLDDLRKKVSKYQNDRRQALEKIAKQRTDAKIELLSKLDPILKNYISENNISLVIDKKNIIAGKNSIDITKIIVEKLNKELPSLKIK